MSKIEVKTVYISLKYQQKEEKKSEEAYQAYLKTYACEYLLKNHSLDEDGIWEVVGEDPNDLGGHHSQPHLFYASGKLIDVIKKAVVTARFWYWGAGGDIKKIKNIEKV